VSDVIDVRPVTSERWDDLTALVGERGAYSGCWCMWFRVPNAVWSANGNGGNRAAMSRLVAEDRVPGLLAYRDGQPVGWVSVAPRPEYGRISGDESAMDHGAPDSPVWSVVCFYIDREHRGSGVASALLSAAIDHARESGAEVLEAYPVEPEGRTDNASAFTGLRSMFDRAGFVEVGRFDRWRAVPDVAGPKPKRLARPPGRPVMRLDLRRRSGSRAP
jgi:GNAT superfamily N-acetyltransferase